MTAGLSTKRLQAPDTCLVLSLAAVFCIGASLSAQDFIYEQRDTREATRQASLDAIHKSFNVPKVTHGPWKFIGPFDNTDGRGHSAVYPPETTVDFDGEYDGAGGRKIRWQDGSRFKDAAYNDLTFLRPNEFVVCYVYRRIESDADTKAHLYLGSDDSLAAWVNGQKVHEYEGIRGLDIDSDTVVAQLRRGTNHALLKVGQIQGGYAFSYRMSPLDEATQSRLDQSILNLDERLDIDFPRGEAAFYRIETISIPKEIKLEVGGMGFCPDGKLMISTRRDEIWSFDPARNRWRKFAGGLHEGVGLHVLGNGDVVVAQRPELTRVRDTDADGTADLFETLCDDFGVSGNYHEYHFGPVRDKEGNLYGTLNVGWEDGGVSWVPYRGWAYKLTPAGDFIPYALGLRSPAGIGMSPDGDIFVADNQGDWWGTSPLLHITEGSFYGHAASLKWEPGYAGPRDPREIDAMKLAPRRKLPAAWFVFGALGNSPAEPVWDTTDGKFGPFNGQMFVGDQTKSFLTRIALEKVGGEFQGAIFPFRAGFASGVLRMAFDPAGKLFVGGTDRGWGSTGGRPYALQKLTWTGRVPFEIHSMNLTKTGFNLNFTKPIDPATAQDATRFSLQHYHYLYHRTYGSPQVDVTPVKVTQLRLSDDRRTLSLALPALLKEKVYELHIRDLKSADGEPLLHPDAYYTLNRLKE